MAKQSWFNYWQGSNSSYFQTVRTGCVAQLPSYSRGTGGSICVGKATGTCKRPFTANLCWD